MKPTPAPPYFPYNHRTMAEVMADERRVRPLFRKNTQGTEGIVDLSESHDNWCATFFQEVA